VGRSSQSRHERNLDLSLRVEDLRLWDVFSSQTLTAKSSFSLKIMRQAEARMHNKQFGSAKNCGRKDSCLALKGRVSSPFGEIIVRGITTEWRCGGPISMQLAQRYLSAVFLRPQRNFVVGSMAEFQNRPVRLVVALADHYLLTSSLPTNPDFNSLFGFSISAQIE